MKFNYSWHKEFPDSILIRDFKGKVNVEEIIKSWTYLLENEMISSKTKGVINNLIGSQLDMNMESFKTLISFLRENDQINRLKLAVLCDNPETIVFPILGQHREHDLSIRPFSTEKAALDWILHEQDSSS